MFRRVREAVLILGILALSAQSVLHTARLIERESGAAREVARQSGR
jgi:hypothetical protein